MLHLTGEWYVISSPLSDPLLAGRELGCWGLGGALPSEAVICWCADMGVPGVCYSVFFLLTIIAVRYRFFSDYSLFINHSLVAVRGFGVWGFGVSGIDAPPSMRSPVTSVSSGRMPSSVSISGRVGSRCVSLGMRGASPCGADGHP